MVDDAQARRLTPPFGLSRFRGPADALSPQYDARALSRHVRVWTLVLVAGVAFLLWPGTARANCHIATWDTNRVRVGEAARFVELFIELDGSGPVTCTGSVRWATTDGSAKAPGDYTASKGEESWKPGSDRRRTIRIPIVNDATIERSETFHATMTAGSGDIVIEQVGPGEGGPTVDILITDDDSPSVSPTAAPTPNGGDGAVPTGSSGAMVGILAAVAVLIAGGGAWLRRKRRRSASSNKGRRRKR